MIQNAISSSDIPLAGPDDFSARGQTIAIIGPDDRHRHEVMRALAHHLCLTSRPFTFYPTLDQVPKIAELDYDIFLVDVDSSPDEALNLIASLSRHTKATVMATSAGAGADLVIRCVRAGVREFLTLPISDLQMEQALACAEERKVTPLRRKELGHLCVFVGAKGGAGTTTIASNFAVAAAQESAKSVLLIDFDLPLGDVILNFGVQPQFSTLDALNNHQRLDGTLLSHFLVQHNSGVSILSAPGKLGPVRLMKEAIDKLIQVSREEFACVVVDAGSRFDLSDTSLFHSDVQLYLVMQISIADLRNSNRVASEFAEANLTPLEVVLNRYSSSGRAIDESHISRALSKPAKWRVPNDFEAVHSMQTTATPLVLENSPIARTIRQMARAGLNLPPTADRSRKRVLGLF